MQCIVFVKLLLIVFDLQVPVCSGENLDCADEIKPSIEGCEIPCTGLYADVTKTGLIHNYSPSYQALLDNYEAYKSFNGTDTTIQYYLPGGDIEQFNQHPTLLSRLQKIQEQTSIFPDLLRWHRIQQDHQGQQGEAPRHDCWGRRHSRPLCWILNYQWN